MWILQPWQRLCHNENHLENHQITEETMEKIILWRGPGSVHSVLCWGTEEEELGHGEKGTGTSHQHQLRSLKAFEVAWSLFSKFIITHDIYGKAVVCFITLFLFPRLYPTLLYKWQLNRSKKHTVSTVGKPRCLLHIYTVLLHHLVSMSRQELWGNLTITHDMLYPRSKVIWANSAWI